MKKYRLKQTTNRDTGNGMQQLDDYEKHLTNNIHVFSNSSRTINSDLESKKCTSLTSEQLVYKCTREQLTVMMERINSKCNSKIIFFLRSKSK